MKRNGFWPLPQYGVFPGSAKDRPPILVDGVTVIKNTEGTSTSTKTLTRNLAVRRSQLV
ncbi:MAG: hypothetical protein WCQ57_05455 [Verrucomicrobiota bacterium]